MTPELSRAADRRSRVSTPDLARLTGLRSGKGSFYPELRVTAQRLDRVVAALDTISRALVQTIEGPENLVRAVAEAARSNLDADWVLLALADGALPEASVRHLILDSAGVAYAFEGFSGAKVPGPSLPDVVLNRLNDILRGQLAQFRIPVIEHQHAHVPIELDGGVIGAFAAWTPPHRTLDGTDAVVMRILASQTAVALQNSALFTKSVTLLTESEAHNAELLATQRELGAAQRHQVLYSERHRIARELHDSVAQTVLSAGMQIEVCRSEVDGLRCHRRPGRPVGSGQGSHPVGDRATALRHLRVQPARRRAPLQPGRDARAAGDRAHARGPSGDAAGRRHRSRASQ